MRRKGTLAAALTALLLVSACERTPDTAVVRQKGENIEKTYEEAEEPDAGERVSLRERLQAPQTYTAQFSKDQITVDCNAAVEIPEAESAGVWRVEQSELTGEAVQTFLEVFAEGELYDWEGKTPVTGEELFRTLEEERRASALVRGEDGALFTVSMKASEQFPYEMKLQRTENPKEELPYSWLELKLAGENAISGEEAQTLAGISLDEALVLAGEKLEGLGIPQMQVSGTELAVHRSGGGDGSDAGIDDAGWMLHCTRSLDGIPVTFEEKEGGSVEGKAYEDVDETILHWGYERVTLIVNEKGVVQASVSNLYTLGERQTENTGLLAFSEIEQIFRDMILIQNAQMEEDFLGMDCRIGRVTFGYARIYEPRENGRSGLLVPVWDFFGSYTTRTFQDGQTLENRIDREYQSLMTINAADGSVIDRTLGY